MFLSKLLNFELNDNKKSTLIFFTHFFIKFSGSQTFFEKFFSENINKVRY
jgi:hypothetical protein